MADAVVLSVGETAALVTTIRVAVSRGHALRRKASGDALPRSMSMKDRKCAVAARISACSGFTKSLGKKGKSSRSSQERE
jgi:hypothetical protein